MDDVERLVRQERWREAEVLCRKGLDKDPTDHWLQTRLSDCLYEQRDYEGALEWSFWAVNCGPRCPLALWARAGALFMLDRNEEALETYATILRMGSEQEGFDGCWEGEGWAAALMRDCRERMRLILGAMP